MYPDLTEWRFFVLRRQFDSGHSFSPFAPPGPPTCENELRSAIPDVENQLGDIQRPQPA